LYYGKVLIGFPISADQHGAAYRVERLGVGKSLQRNPTKDNILSAIKEILPSLGGSGKYQENMERVRRILHFKELRSGRDLSFHILRAMKFH
jgi:UDP:flavonoid glycosyltransferase YjiC (YdhE family)